MEMMSNRNLAKEASNFLKFLDGLLSFSLSTSRKEESDDSHRTPSIYKNGIINLALVFVGDPDVIRGTHYGYEPYVDFIERTTEKGIDTFYLLARGKMNTLIADATAKIVENGKLKITDRYIDKVKIDDKTIDTICIRMEKKQGKSQLLYRQ